MTFWPLLWALLSAATAHSAVARTARAAPTAQVIQRQEFPDGLRKGIIWAGPGRGADLRDESRSQTIDMVKNLARIEGGDISPLTEKGYLKPIGTLDEFRATLKTALDQGAASPETAFELTVAFDGHGAIDQHERFYVAGAAPDGTILMARYLDVMVEEIDARPGLKEKLSLNLLASTCYSGHCGPAVAGHPISRQSYPVTAFGFTGLGQTTYGDRSGPIARGAAAIDKRLRARGVDLCPDCTWAERLARVVGGFPVWLSVSFDELGAPAVFGREEVTKPVSNAQMMEVVQEILAYRFGGASFFGFARLMAERSRDARQRAELGALAAEHGERLPLAKAAWLLSQGRLEDGLTALAGLLERPDAQSLGSIDAMRGLLDTIRRDLDRVLPLPASWEMPDALLLRFLTQLDNIRGSRRYDYHLRFVRERVEAGDRHPSILSYLLYHSEQSDAALWRRMDREGDGPKLVQALETNLRGLDPQRSDEARDIRLVLIKALMSGSSSLAKRAIAFMGEASGTKFGEWARSSLLETRSYWNNPLYLALTARMAADVGALTAEEAARDIVKLRKDHSDSFRGLVPAVRDYLKPPR